MRQFKRVNFFFSPNEGLHYGYFRDDPREMPAFVVSSSKNRGNFRTLVSDSVSDSVSLPLYLSLESSHSRRLPTDPRRWEFVRRRHFSSQLDEPLHRAEEAEAAHEGTCKRIDFRCQSQRLLYRRQDGSREAERQEESRQALSWRRNGCTL